MHLFKKEYIVIKIAIKCMYKGLGEILPAEEIGLEEKQIFLFTLNSTITFLFHLEILSEVYIWQ